ncbi:MAG: hypothetical protein AAF389_18835 [Gemmatimonadota bacterium]
MAAVAMAHDGSPGPQRFSHADALRVVAREYGFPSWPALKEHVAVLQSVDVFALDAVSTLDRRFRALFPDGGAHRPVIQVLTVEADAVLRAHEAGDGHGVMQIRDWTPVLIGKSPEELIKHPLSREQAFDGVAREHGYADWSQVPRKGGALIDPVFERAVDAVVTGQLGVLDAMLADRPSLTTQRSAYGHQAQLLHYCGANGVETRRQMTPSNAPSVVRRLLEAGAEVDALCNTYGGGPSQTTLCLTISSGHPANAGVQVEMVEALLDGGAAVDGLGTLGEPLRLAVHCSRLDVAALLHRSGGTVTDLVTAVILDDHEGFLERLSADPPGQKEVAFLTACSLGRTPMLAPLADEGVNPRNAVREGVGGMHLAAKGGHRTVVEWLIQAGVDPHEPDTRLGLRPSEWARRAGHVDLARLLEAGSVP